MESFMGWSENTVGSMGFRYFVTFLAAAWVISGRPSPSSTTFSRCMWQIGQSPGWSWMICGCMEHWYRVLPACRSDAAGLVFPFKTRTPAPRPTRLTMKANIHLLVFMVHLLGSVGDPFGP